MKTKVLFADDSEEIDYQSYVDLFGPGYDLIRTDPADVYTHAIEIWRRCDDILVALVDLRISKECGDKDERVGFELIRELKAIRPESKIAVLSAFVTSENLSKAAQSGADGFIAKDWQPEQIQYNLEFLVDWISAGSALSAFCHSIELRNPYTSGHSSRVKDYCRLIIRYLRPANPENFDLTACLVSAELHDLGKLEMPDDILMGSDLFLTQEQRRVIERHVNAARELKHLGRGFDKVASIAYQHHRRYKEPDVESLTDYPDDPDLPRGDSIPFEARVLHVADVLDALMSDRSYRPGMDLNYAMRVIEEETESGSFDPKVVRALRLALEKDVPSFERIAEDGKLRDEKVLTLLFYDKRLTVSRLQTILKTISDVYLNEGKARDRLAVRSVQIGSFEDKGTVKIELIGSEDDIDETAQILRRRKEELEAILSGKKMSEFPDVLIRGLQQAMRFAIATSP